MTRELDTLGKRVKARRELFFPNQSLLAEACGMKQGDISKIENGEILQTTKIAQLARALQCDAYWLATGDGEVQPGKEFVWPFDSIKFSRFDDLKHDQKLLIEGKLDSLIEAAEQHVTDDEKRKATTHRMKAPTNGAERRKRA